MKRQIIKDTILDYRIYNLGNQVAQTTVTVLVRKVDALTGANIPTGGASLAGARFTVRFYEGQYTLPSELTGLVPIRSWVLQTNSNGYAMFNSLYLVSGDAFWTNEGVCPHFLLVLYL